MFTTTPCPQGPHPHAFWPLPGMAIPRRETQAANGAPTRQCWCVSQLLTRVHCHLHAVRDKHKNLHFQGEIRWWGKEELVFLSSCIGLEKTTTVAAAGDSRVPAGDTMGSLQLFRQAVLRKWQPSSLSHISEAEVAAFIPLFCDLASWHYSWWKMNQVLGMRWELTVPHTC